MDILVSGAGIAGTTVATLLARRGFSVTVVERSIGQRSSGNPVDVRGPAYPVAAELGVVPALRAAATQVRGMIFVDAEGRTVGRFPINIGGGPEVELPRGDLARILWQAGRDDAEYRFDTSISALAQDSGGVDVELSDGSSRRFDYVIGADGLHSGVRSLVFGPESAFIRHLGLYVATVPFDGPVDPTRVVMHNVPGKSVTLHPGSGSPIAAFIWRSPVIPDFDHQDTAQHRRLLASAYAGVGWRTPDLLAGLGSDLYFDSVSKSVVPSWSVGRVALLGDAASCVSLFGEGSSLAMAGAATLASTLAAGGFLADYEVAHRRLVAPRQRSMALASHLIVPATATGLHLRNAVSRLVPKPRRVTLSGTPSVSSR
jgi:2-polyprenyl-6-methoxyphenol hydroxylase-like FAD-dependent oxidoreductase